MSRRRDKDFATGKPVDFSKPEEEVRQAYERILHNDFGYPRECIDIEVPIAMGSSRKICDIAVYDGPEKENIIGIVETKSPRQKSGSAGKAQLQSYMSATPACRWGVWTNSDEVECAFRDLKTGKIVFDPAFSVPRCGETAVKINSFADLRPASNLKWVFRLINNHLYANSAIPRAEKQGAAMVRLIFCKLYDEYTIRGGGGAPRFQAHLGENKEETRRRINQLWKDTQSGWLGGAIFAPGEKIAFDDYSLGFIVGNIQGYSLLNTDRDVVGDAFEVFSEKQFAGEYGQFFTPRAVVKMIVGMINPGKNETIIDPACGSGGFLVAALSHITSGAAGEEEKRQIAEHCLYGIDKDGDLSKICKAQMSIIGDGKSNIATGDSLDPRGWDDHAKSKFLEGGEPRRFDVVLTNPPFGSKIKVVRDEILRRYELGHKWKWDKARGKWKKTAATKDTPPQVLFIERCMQFLKPGGRMGIVLPDGLLGNPSDGYIRQWMEERAEILAVLDCPTETFMPHTGTKTSVIIMRKKPAKTGGRIFFAVSEHCGHTMRGKEIRDARGCIREDFSGIVDNYRKNNLSTHLGFNADALIGGVLVPRYYDPRILKRINDLESGGDAHMVSIAKLQEDGALEVCGVPASVKSEEYDKHGEIRFIRTSDISGYEIYEHTQKMVSAETYERHREKQDMQIHDILFVKDGDNKIGETAILLDGHDRRILVQTHFKKIRPLSANPFLLLWLLNTEIVKRQIRQRVFNQSTLSTIGNRIMELRLPMPGSARRRNEISAEIERLVKSRRAHLRELRQKMEIK